MWQGDLEMTAGRYSERLSCILYLKLLYALIMSWTRTWKRGRDRLAEYDTRALKWNAVSAKIVEDLPHRLYQALTQPLAMQTFLLWILFK